MKESEFQLQLAAFLRLLKKEKNFLIKDQAEKLVELVKQKEKYVPILNGYQGAASPKTKELAAQIQVQQDENMLLTKQALSYQKMLMTAIKDNIKAPGATYSKYKTVKQQARTALIDREV
ncbi:flagella synthesis protein FlgN [Liquorilactobacillus sucicola DSM 21376 = JCM 15457]|uniref:Flagella synthesis protein FlgN n=2 Tax=Liquorilactobacillus sucicola TaxID=519050 RepID=A0A023CXV0_9LACO|nr:hypothetical protein [Liquorilactobacillus sucicola]AJA34350.1 flagella synthesis protein FlgN [Liquorilactobacillus sucicola]KRN06868.1 hypothetical protein FD15_GL000427 [Liquorilactobacillus sucicola DSM 21376 = JCM 15457]GAJ26345.1 flagella synthesis protein FlgN [Liquorilactobacillus sucicola DSM 21376 = JCM 15457]